MAEVGARRGAGRDDSESSDDGGDTPTSEEETSSSYDSNSSGSEDDAEPQPSGGEDTMLPPVEHSVRETFMELVRQEARRAGFGIVIHNSKPNYMYGLFS